MQSFFTSKITKITTAIFALVFLLSASGIANAQANPEINYQGKLTNASGVAVPDGLYNLNFWLVPSSGGATSTAIWSEARTGGNTVQVTNGLFSVMLGSVSALSGVDFDQTLYLAVEIGGTGTAAWDGELLPRKVLGTVPAAFVANYATTAGSASSSDALGGVASSSFLRSDQADSMTATSTGTLLSLVQNGIGKVLSLFSGVTEVFTVLNNGNVGVGTSTPVSKLSVVGDSTFNGNISISGTIQAPLLTPGRVIYSTTGSYLTDTANFVFDGTNLGIGTSTPSSRLSVQGNSTFIGNSTTTGSSYYGGNVGIGTGVSSYSLSLGGSQMILPDNGHVYFSNTNTFIGENSNSNKLELRGGGNSGVSTVFIDSNGAIGVGDASPNYKIEVAGTSTSGYFAISSTAAANADVFAVNGVGNVGIGTSTPSSKLTVAGDIFATGALRDSANSAGTNGMILRTTGTGSQWVATSTLGLSSSFTNSAGLAALLSDETGTGNVVFSTNPIFTTPNLGTPSTLVGTNITGTAAGLTAGNATTLATPRTIAGVSFDGSANISLNNNAITNGAGYITSADDTVSGTELDGVFSANGFLKRTGVGTYTNQATIDISADTNLAVGNGVTLTGDTLTVTAAGGLLQTTGGLTTTGVLEDLNTLGAPASDGQIIVATGAGAFAYESGTTARTSLGATTVGSNVFTLTNPSAITFLRVNADNTVSALDAASFRTAIGAGSGGGSVTSVALSAPVGFSVSGSPVTTSGTLALSYAAGYEGMLTASSTNWNAFYNTPSSRITAGTSLSWSANTLNCATASGSVQGCLTAADWTTFNNKVSTTSIDTSAKLAAILSDETGTGNVVFSTNPIFTTPNLGTPSTLVGTNITGTAAGLTAGSVTTNANLTGMVTSVGNAASLGSFTSSNLLTALTDETGTGVAVFGTSPVFTTQISTPVVTSTGTLLVDSNTSNALNIGTGANAKTITIGNGTGASSLVLNSGTGAINIGTSIAKTITIGNNTGATGLVFNSGTSGTAFSNGNVSIGTTTMSSKLTVAGDLRLTGAFKDSTNATGTLGMVLQTNGTSTQWVATSTLGLGGVTNFLALTDTISSFNANRVLYTSGAAVIDNANFTYDGTNLGLGGNNGIAFGGTRFITASSTTNSVTFGQRAGETFKSTNLYGVAIGYEAGRYASTSSTTNGVYIGYQSGYSDDGVFNVIIGDETGKFAKGDYNTLIGNGAGWEQTGDYNTSLGSWAGFGSTGGTNSFIGVSSGQYNTGGWNNMLGFDVGYYNTGNSNEIMGYQAGYNNTGNNNVLLGTYAGYNNTGNFTIAIGDSAALNKAAGADSIMIGRRAGYALSGANNVVLGQNAIGGTAVAFNSANNVAIGSRSGFNMAAGSNNNILLGYQAGENITTGDNNIILGYDIDLPSATGNNKLNIGNLIFGTGLDGTGTTLASGNVGIGSSTPSSKLTVAGDTYIGGGLRLTGAFKDSNNATGTLGMVLQTNGTSTQWVATSTLGLGGATNFLALTDTVSSFNANRVLYTSGAAVIDNANFTYDGTNLGLGGNNGIAFGGVRMFSASTTLDNISIGANSLLNVTTGSENLVVGKDAGRSITSGQNNTALGNGTFGSTTAVNTGIYNTALGQNSLFNNTTGIHNTATGYRSLNSNSSGISNSAYGSFSLQDNTDGASNTAIGYSALSKNTSGWGNTANGAGSLSNNITGSYNAAVGHDSLKLNTTGGYNTVTGNNSLYSNNAGSYNTAFGYQAGYDINTATSTGANTVIGYNTGRGIVTGVNNTILGANVTGLSSTLSNNIIIADGAGNQRINVGSTGNVGIGTTTPQEKLHVDGGNFLLSNATGNNMTIRTQVANGNDSEFIFEKNRGGAGAPAAIASGDDLGTIRFRGFDGTSYVDGAYILGDSSGTISTGNIGGILRLGTNGTERLRINADGKIGIGTTTPDSLLSLSKTGFTGAGVAGISQYFTSTNSTLDAVQYGNSSYLYATNTATTTIIGNITRIADSTTFGNTVRGIEVQVDNGNNTKGENTAISGFARTFGVRGTTVGDAGGVYEPAGVFGETEGTTQGNAIRGYSSSITTTALLKLFQDTSAFTGTGLLMNFGNAGGSFSSTTASKFIDLQNAGSSRFSVGSYGMLTIGNGGTVNNAGIQIGYGGLCVDNDGSCTASTTGRISAVSYHTGNSDLAENYFSNENLKSGEVVYLKGGLSIGRATEETKEKVIGVVTTKPGLLLGFDDTSLNAGETGYGVALAGRVPVRLSNENGEIKVGDELMLSSLPGIVMKATSTGKVVGIALEDFNEARAYSNTYINQFGDDLVEPVITPITNNDPRINDGCYYGGGNASGDEICVPLIATTTDAQIAEAEALAQAQAQLDALAALAYVPSQNVTLQNGEKVKVGQIVMFVELKEVYLDVQGKEMIAALLASAESAQVIDGVTETVWQRLVSLANNFIDGVLSVFTLKADRVEVKNEICVDGVCLNADDIRQMLDSSNSGGTESTPEPEPEPEEEIVEEVIEEEVTEEEVVEEEVPTEEVVEEETTPEEEVIQEEPPVEEVVEEVEEVPTEEVVEETPEPEPEEEAVAEVPPTTP